MTGVQGAMDDNDRHQTCNEVSTPLVVAPREACRMLSIGLTRLYELLHDGDLESYRDGGSRRITVASIQAYVERQLKVNPAPLGNRVSRS